MKKLTAVVRQEKLEVLKQALFDKGIRGMTISQVQGCGNQHGWKEYVRGTEVLLNTIPKVEFEIVVDDEQVNDLVQVVMLCRCLRRECMLGRWGRPFGRPVVRVRQ